MVGGSGQVEHGAARVQPGESLFDGAFRFVDCAQRDYVEPARGWQRFAAGGPHRGAKTKDAHCLLEERGFFVLGLSQHDHELRMDKLDGEAWEASSGTKIEQGCRSFGYVTGGEEGFAEVAFYDIFRLADRREIGAGVPAEQEVEVERELKKQLLCWGGKVGLDEPFDCAVRKGGHSVPATGAAGGPFPSLVDEPFEECGGGGASGDSALWVPLHPEDVVRRSSGVACA